MADRGVAMPGAAALEWGSACGPSGWKAWGSGDGMAADMCAVGAEPHDMAQDVSTDPVGQQHAFAGAVHPSFGAQPTAGAQASAAAATLAMTKP